MCRPLFAYPVCLALCHRLVSAAVRVNMVVALADLCHRWPNVLEPWTAYMYEPLAGAHGQYSTVQYRHCGTGSHPRHQAANLGS
jgi:hypothetical protein